jgi:hypothetical protein
VAPVTGSPRDWRGCRPAPAALDRFFSAAGLQDPQVAWAGQKRQETLHRLLAGRLHHQQQQMLAVDECLGLDGDAVTGRRGGRDPGQQQRSAARGGGALVGGVTVLGDEQSDGSLLS